MIDSKVLSITLSSSLLKLKISNKYVKPAKINKCVSERDFQKGKDERIEYSYSKINRISLAYEHHLFDIDNPKFLFSTTSENGNELQNKLGINLLTDFEIESQTHASLEPKESNLNPIENENTLEDTKMVIDDQKDKFFNTVSTDIGGPRLHVTVSTNPNNTQGSLIFHKDLSMIPS